MSAYGACRTCLVGFLPIPGNRPDPSRHCICEPPTSSPTPAAPTSPTLPPTQPPTRPPTLPPTPSPTPTPTVPCAPGAAGAACEYSAQSPAMATVKGVAHCDSSCTCQSGYSDAWSIFGRCLVCLAGLGENCQYTDETTCNCQGAVTSDGTCTCIAGQTNGPNCEYSNAVTCNGRGSVDHFGICACAPGWSNDWGDQPATVEIAPKGSFRFAPET